MLGGEAEPHGDAGSERVMQGPLHPAPRKYQLPVSTAAMEQSKLERLSIGNYARTSPQNPVRMESRTLNTVSKLRAHIPSQAETGCPPGGSWGSSQQQDHSFTGSSVLLFI